MWIFRINSFFQNSWRLVCILYIISMHSIKNWFYGKRFLRRIIDPTGKRLTTRAERIRLMIEDLGPTFIKFGQIVADRPDLISEQLRNELKKLQSAAQPFDNKTAIGIIEEELGDTIPELFKEFDPLPIAAASIAQVYKAVLHNGEVVAVKVQRPNIKQKISVDLVLMKMLAKQSVKLYPELTSFNIVGFVEDFSDVLKKELDFANEASNMLRFADMFKNDGYCYIPKVYSNHTTQKVLMMEFVQGMMPASKEVMEAEGFDTDEIARNGTNVILKMILRYGFFHADPHPGNILIGTGNKIILLDHGMVASLKPSQIQGLINFMMGFARHDTRRITKALLALLEVTYYKDEADLEFEISELIQKYNYLPYDKVDISILLAETFKIILRHGLKIPSNLYMLLKAIGTIQKFAENLQAGISMIDMIEPYAREKIKEKFSFDAILNKVINSAEDYLYIVDKLPGDIKEIISNLKRGVLKHEINFREDSFTNKAISENINRLSYVFVMGLMLICSTLLMIFVPGKTIVSIFFYVSITIVAWTAFKLLLKTAFR